MSASASPTLYRRTVALDPALHRHRRISPLVDFSVAADLHAVFITATEFPQAGLELPLLFVATGEHDAHGLPEMSTVALLGLAAGENLQLDGGRWIGRYIPAYIRRYPFAAAGPPESEGAYGIEVLVDDTWTGFADEGSEALFEADDRPAPALRRTIDFLERFEREAARTRAFCERVVGLDVLKSMKAEATLPNGERISIDGFHAIDEDRMHALPGATVVELHRTGLLMLMQMHLASLANIRHLVNRKAERLVGRPH